MNVHLIDGTFELFRSYYGAPQELSPAGQEVGATKGFLRGLLGLLTDGGVTFVACAFDQVIESFRNELFPGYKTGEGIEPALWAQFPLVERASQALGVVTWQMVEFEADDAIATAAARFAEDPQVDQVVICSPDKDFAQCVTGDRVVLWDRIRGKIYDEAAVIEKWGVEPRSIPDWLALVGDSADGIPGVPKWGQKSAAAVLAEYKHLEKIPPDERHWYIKVRGAKALGEALRAQANDVLLYKTLATLRRDVPLAETLDDLRWRGANRALLEELCREIGYERFVERVPLWREA